MTNEKSIYTAPRWWVWQLACIFTAAVLSAVAVSHAAERPNVLMIVVDDMNDWVGCLGGHPDAKTPHIDRLAERGMLFSNAHVAAPVCNPSRVAVLTGRRPSATGVYDNSVVWHQVVPGIATIPQHFKDNGYHVVGGGKVNHYMPGFNRRSDWHEYFEQVFDGDYHDRLTRGLDVSDYRWPDGFPLNRLEAVKSFAKPPNNAKEFDWGALDKPDAEMGDGQMVEWAVKFLAQPPGQPFFLAAGIYRPHPPFYAPRKYFEMYPQDRITLPPVKADDCDDLPAAGKTMAANRRGDYELARSLPQTDAPSRRKAKKKQVRTSSQEEPTAATSRSAVSPYPMSPYPMSQVVGEFTIDPERQSIGHGDNWAITWAADNKQYSFHTDGRGFGLPESVSTAPVVIEGSPPAIRGHDIVTTSGSIPKPDGNKSGKVSGVVMIQNVLYAWVRNLNPPDKPKGTGSTLMVSRNLGKDWNFVEWSFPNIGYPTWLNAGQDYRAAADGYAYFIAPDGPSAYADYPDLLMGRVPVQAMLDKSRYEFFHGVGKDNSSTWGDYDRRRPIFSDPAGCFRPDLVFNPGRGRYLLMMSSPPVKWHWWANDNPQRVSHFGLFDAPNPWGPWTTVAYIKDWGKPETRFAPHIPPKWISDDGMSFYLLYSCIPKGPYRFNLQRCRVDHRRPAQ